MSNSQPLHQEQTVLGLSIERTRLLHSLVVVSLLIGLWSLGIRRGLDAWADARCRSMRGELRACTVGSPQPSIQAMSRELFWWGLVSEGGDYELTLDEVLRHMSPAERSAIRWRRYWQGDRHDLQRHFSLLRDEAVFAIHSSRPEQQLAQIRSLFPFILDWCEQFERDTPLDWQYDREITRPKLQPLVPITRGYTGDPQQWLARIDYWMQARWALRSIDSYQRDQQAHVCRAVLLAELARHWSPIIQSDARLEADCERMIRASLLSPDMKTMLQQAVVNGEPPAEVPHW